jgi:hypothetical protein
MLHLIPNNRYTDLCTKAVESILKTYDLGHDTKDFTLCDRWDLDKLIDVQTTVPGVIKNVVPGQLCDYLVEAEIGKLYDTFYWQPLPTDAWEADRVVAELEPLLAKSVKVQFLMPMTISQQQWYEMFATGMKTKTMQTLTKYGKRISVLQPLEMSTLVYTLPDRSKHRSLMVAATRLTPKTRMAVMEIIRVFIEPLDEILAEQRKLPELF